MLPALDISTQAVTPGRSYTKHWLVSLLLAEICTVSAPVGLLSTYFRFPEILREPASVALPLFAAHESLITLAYYLFMLSGMLYLPISVLLRKKLSTSTADSSLNLMVSVGVATAIFQTIGFSRWIFAVPYLAHRYQQTTAVEVSRPTIELLYSTLNTYLGMTIGEHIGFIAMGVWTICLGRFLRKDSRFPRWFSVAGILIGGLIIISVGEHFGGVLAGLWSVINVVANSLWTIWLLLLTVLLVRQVN